MCFITCQKVFSVLIFDIYLHQKATIKLETMLNEITYKGRTIIEGTNGYFTAYPSNHSAHSARDFKTLGGAKTYIAGKLNSYNFVNAN